MGNRDELIQTALMEKLSGGITLTIYTADDILTAADISDDEMQNFQKKIKSEIEKIATKKQRKGGDN